ncbi:putative reverse transcriptase domain, reverse transcriptase zinc-binding domain protein [Tanacetum coccineum]
MSPYLFTLVMEVLTLMLHRRARVCGSFTYHRYCSKLNSINLCFVDDHFLFTHGDVDSARIIMDTLEEFKEALRLTPSLPKSTAYFCNVLNYIKIDILNILPLEEGKLPVMYLGVHLVPSRLLCRDCKELMEKSWPDVWMSKYSDLGTIGVPHLFDASDKLVWKDLSNVDVGFLVATVWDHLKRLTGIPNIPSGLDAIVDFLSPMAKMRSARSVISKLGDGLKEEARTIAVLFFPSPRFFPLGFSWEGFLRRQGQLAVYTPMLQRNVFEALCYMGPV